MRWLLFGLIALHGCVHLLGCARAFGIAGLTAAASPPSRASGVVWLAAAFGLLLTAVLYLLRIHMAWMVAFGAVVLSQAAIVTSWSEAKYGTLANLLILAGAAYGFAAHGPLGFRAQYRRAVADRLGQPAAVAIVTETDLAPLPDPVRRYLRVTGSVGQPRVRSVRARWRGRIRATPADPWMEFTAEQHDFFERPARFFLMDARRGGLPVDVYHVFGEGAASMRVRLLSLIPLAHAAGPDFARTETVTLFNDLCLLAPAALIDPAIRWEPVDDRAARAHYRAGSYTISALLLFNDAGELVDFISDDRLAASANGASLTPRRWSTPVGEYRAFGARRLLAHGVGRWHQPEGEFDYIELELLDVQANPPP